MLADGTGAYPWKLCKEEGKERAKREKKEQRMAERRSIVGDVPKFQQRIPLFLHLSERHGCAVEQVLTTFQSVYRGGGSLWIMNGNDPANCSLPPSLRCSLKRIPNANIHRKQKSFTYQFHLFFNALWRQATSPCIADGRHIHYINIYVTAAHFVPPSRKRFSSVEFFPTVAEVQSFPEGSSKVSGRRPFYLLWESNS